MRTHCKNGHDLAVVGTYRDKGKIGTKCRQCSREYDEALRERNRRARDRAREASGADSAAVIDEPVRDPTGALDMFARAEVAMPWEREAIREKARAMARGDR